MANPYQDLLDRLRGSAPSILAMREAADAIDRLQSAVDRAVWMAAERGTVLAHIRKNAGECVADNPKWLAKIDDLIGPAAPDEDAETA